MRNFKVENVDAQDFLSRLKLRNIEEATTQEIKFSCPFPGHTGGDENPSAYMNVNSTAWYCHGCKRRGNAVTFMADLFNFSNYESLRFLKDIYGGGFQNPETTLEDEINRYFMEFGKPDAEPINYVLQKTLLSDFALTEEARQYLYDRGFHSFEIEDWQLGYDKLSERITIPIFDELGRLIGFKGRTMDPNVKPKYKVLGGSQYGFPRYHVGQVVYGLDKRPAGAKSVILVEGELNAIAMHQLGWKQTVAAGGSTFTNVHAKKIIDCAEGVVLFYDSDKAGYEATKHTAELLMPHMPVFTVPEHEYDPADVLKELPTIWEQKEYVRAVLSGRSAMLTLMVE